MAKDVNMIIAGVGGQGSILASRIIADSALKMELGETESPMRVRVGETFGAAMRGGAVSSHVRVGDVVSPLVPQGECHLIVGLEPLEALRCAAKYLAPGGTVVLNTEEVPPTDVKVGKANYPDLDSIKAAIEGLGGKTVTVNATAVAAELGTVRCMNVVMLGVAFSTGLLPVSEESFLDAIASRVPAKYKSVNLEAFRLGKEAGLHANG